MQFKALHESTIIHLYSQWQVALPLPLPLPPQSYSTFYYSREVYYVVVEEGVWLGDGTRTLRAVVVVVGVVVVVLGLPCCNFVL